MATSTGVLIVFLGSAGGACGQGQICYSSRVINQWACETCKKYEWRCLGNTDITCSGPGNQAECSPHSNPCALVCTDTNYVGQCTVLNVTVGCNNTGPGQCSWTGQLTDCVWNGGVCSEPNRTDTLGCCGPGAPPTNTPIPPTPTPTNSVPIGWHDGYQGNVNQVQCEVVGWTTDPDNTGIDLSVRILEGGNTVTTTTANIFRSGLEPYCSGGTCEFRKSICWWLKVREKLV